MDIGYRSTSPSLPCLPHCRLLFANTSCLIQWQSCNIFSRGDMEREVTKCKLYPLYFLIFLFLSPLLRISVTHFASPGVPLDAPARFLLPFSSHSLPSLLPSRPFPPSFVPFPQLYIPSVFSPFLLPLSLPPLLNLARRSRGAL